MNRIQLLIFGSIGGLVILAILLVTGIIPGLKPRVPPAFTLTVWGVSDKPDLWRELGRQYRENRISSATINYEQKNPATYEAELLNALAEGSGPDIFVLPNTLLKKHQNKIAALPDGAQNYESSNARSTFADGITDVVIGEMGELRAIPLAFDTVALFYNRDHFNAANIPNPPQTWDELLQNAESLTRKSEIGSIRRGGVALGTASNVTHAADVIRALILQNGGDIIRDGQNAFGGKATEDAVRFATSFADATRRHYSWNSFFESSLESFANGEVSMAFGYASDIPRVVALNPQLNFSAAPLPQPSGSELTINVGHFDAWVVSRTSRQFEYAWEFLRWLGSEETEKFYIDATGLPPARRDLTRTKPPREYLVPFYDSVLTAKAEPFELGDSLGGIFNDMIDLVASRRFTPGAAVTRAGLQIQQLLSREQSES